MSEKVSTAAQGLPSNSSQRSNYFEQENERPRALAMIAESDGGGIRIAKSTSNILRGEANETGVSTSYFSSFTAQGTCTVSRGRRVSPFSERCARTGIRAKFYRPH